MRYFVISMLMMLGAALAAAAQGDDTTVAAQRHQRMLSLAKSYTLFGSDASLPAKLHETPIFSWASPERQAIGGELYLWTLAGRPLATIGIWTYDDLKDSHELQSLSPEPLKATSDSGFVWQPKLAGLVFKRLPGAPAPDQTAVRRQVQMRSFLRSRFTADMIKGEGGQRVQLRLLTQPLYRYESLPPGVIDGAMFAFAMGTDPEVMVLLEARQDGDAVAWYYAFAPATSQEVHGHIDGQKVWDSTDQEANGTFVFFFNR